MAVNLWTSRRTNFHFCRYWKRDKSVRDRSALAHEKKPAGSFYARDISAQTADRNAFGDAFMFDQGTITLVTEDTVSVAPNDIVEYDGAEWLTLNVQVKRVGKTEQYCRRPAVYTYIQLKR